MATYQPSKLCQGDSVLLLNPRYNWFYACSCCPSTYSTAFVEGTYICERANSPRPHDYRLHSSWFSGFYCPRILDVGHLYTLYRLPAKAAVKSGWCHEIPVPGAFRLLLAEALYTVQRWSSLASVVIRPQGSLLTLASGLRLPGRYPGYQDLGG